MMAVDRSRLPALGPEPAFTFPEIRRRRLAQRPARLDGRAPRGAAASTCCCCCRPAPPTIRPICPGLAAITGDLLDEGCGDLDALEFHEALGRLGAQLDTEVGSDATLLGLTTLERFAERGAGAAGRHGHAAAARAPPSSIASATCALNRLLAAARHAAGGRRARVHRSGSTATIPTGTCRSARRRRCAALTRRRRRRGSTHAITIRRLRDADRRRRRDRTTASPSSPSAAFGQLAAGERTGAAPIRSAPPTAAARRAAGARAPRRARRSRSCASATWRCRAARPTTTRWSTLNMVLGGQFVSRINMNLREDKGYTYGARTSFDFRRGRGPVRAAGQRAVRRHRRRGARGARRAPRHPRRAAGHARGAASSAAPR